MVFELNALFHEPQALVQELLITLPSRGSKGFKEGRKGWNSSGQTQREREREKNNHGICNCYENLSWRFAFFQH
jgi:hypothetical protein